VSLKPSTSGGEGWRAPAATRQKRRAATCGGARVRERGLGGVGGGERVGLRATARLVDALGVEVCARARWACELCVCGGCGGCVV